MRLIILHKNNNALPDTGNSTLRFGVSHEPVTSVIFDGLNKSLSLNGAKDLIIAVPEKWRVKPFVNSPKIIYYQDNIPLPPKKLRPTKRNSRLIISNGRFATQINNELLNRLLTELKTDVIAVNVEPELKAPREKVRLTPQGKLVGFRRWYSDCAEPIPLSDDWPHHIFIRVDAVDKLLPEDTLSHSFSLFLQKCRSNGLTMHSISVAGTVLDLATEEGLLGFTAVALKATANKYSFTNFRDPSAIVNNDSVKISDTARLFGRILFGQNVTIGQNAVIAGPTIISSGVKISQGAIVRASIVGPGILVPRNGLVQNRILIKPENCKKQSVPIKTSYPTTNINAYAIFKNTSKKSFRIWPRFSYARFFKRIADIVAAITVIMLFVPFFPIIALIIKLTSRGSVFFKDKRQGLHAKEFQCLKFRTMLVGADKIQDKLRVVNQLDGPQFKMEDDPRINNVGRFLRDTYIDEILQFFNVLLGQMSVVGPRPSPESENTLCPFWRDARLSVRPGITGLWQVCRTREPMKDFQEWIHYDVKYVKNLSLKLDLWICLQTVKKMMNSFFSQFERIM